MQIIYYLYYPQIIIRAHLREGGISTTFNCIRAFSARQIAIRDPDGYNYAIMIRDIDENLIRPERLMSSSDMARLGCDDCAGCSECCKDRASAITLDEWDVSRLKEGLGMDFDTLLSRDYIDITMVDGILLPALGRKKDVDECVFLGEDGRCTIHDLRPGICRMFPLARIYHEDGSFSYFIQSGECPREGGAKIKISKWLGVGNIIKYEQTVRRYHDSLTALRSACANAQSREEIVQLQKEFLEEHFQQ